MTENREKLLSYMNDLDECGVDAWCEDIGIIDKTETSGNAVNGTQENVSNRRNMLIDFADKFNKLLSDDQQFEDTIFIVDEFESNL